MNSQDIANAMAKIRELDAKEEIPLHVLNYLGNAANDRLNKIKDGETKMYHINPNNWDLEWHVAATSASDALFSLQHHLKKLADAEARREKPFQNHRNRFNKWKSARTDKLPDGYTIEEYNINQILEGEVA